MYLCFHETLTSTHQYVKELISLSKTTKEIAILANNQDYGVGKRGVAWQSFAGNIHLSMVLPSKYFSNQWGRVSLLSSVIIREVLQKYLNKDIIAFSKWPNDILIQNAKIAGILIELIKNQQDVEHCIISTGINLVQAPRLQKYKTIALKDVSNSNISNLALSLEIIATLQQYLQQGFQDTIISKWLEKAYKLNQAIKIKVANNYECGIFEGLTSNGELILKTKLEKKLLIAGNIIF